MYYGGFTWTETMKLPVSYKKWFIDRISKELTRTDDSGQSQPVAQTRALHQNDPSTRTMQGLTRAEGPSRTRRFT
jgi:hypothetical protein